MSFKGDSTDHLGIVLTH